MGGSTEHTNDTRSSRQTSKGYILEVDLEYPSNLHYEHNAYTLAPKRLEVPKEWLSEYQRNLLKGIYGSESKKGEKLVHIL